VGILADVMVAAAVTHFMTTTGTGNAQSGEGITQV
jgi:hypothetical protein